MGSHILTDSEKNMFNALDSSGRISFLKQRPEYVRYEYIDCNKSYAKLREQWGISNGAVYKVICHLGLNSIKIKDKLTTCDESKFTLDDPIFCYYLGLIATDGYYDIKYHRVVTQMSIQALNVLEYLADYFKVSSGVREYHKENKLRGPGVVYDLTISSNRLIDLISHYGCLCKKEEGNRILKPEYLESLSDECLSMYFRGIWDGDGTISYRNEGSILEIREDMILSIASIINIAGLKHVDYFITSDVLPSGKTAYTLRIPEDKGLDELYDWMYSTNLDCCIKEKHTKYLELFRSNLDF